MSISMARNRDHEPEPEHITSEDESDETEFEAESDDKEIQQMTPNQSSEETDGSDSEESSQEVPISSNSTVTLEKSSSGNKEASLSDSETPASNANGTKRGAETAGLSGKEANDSEKSSFWRMANPIWSRFTNVEEMIEAFGTEMFERREDVPGRKEWMDLKLREIELHAKIQRVQYEKSILVVNSLKKFRK